MKADDKIGVYPSTEPTGADVAVKECQDLLVADHSTIIPGQFATRLNSAVIEAFHRSESRAFARIRETAISTAQADFYQTESRVNWLHRVLDEAARRLGVKP